MAYVVGLMATDGCLYSNGRHLSFDSSDEELVITLLECLGRPIRYTRIAAQTGNLYYRAQFGDVAFHKWLGSKGLMPRKSLVLGAIEVPDDLIFPLARGLLDGDGSVLDYWYDGSGKAKGKRYEGFATVFLSASGPHLEWLRTQLARSLSIRGALCPQTPTERGTVMWRLAYAIRESAILLPQLYPSRDVPCLRRKWRIWEGYAARRGLRATLDQMREASAMYRMSA